MHPLKPPSRHATMCCMCVYCDALGEALYMLLKDTLAQRAQPPPCDAARTELLEMLKQLTFAVFLPLLIFFDTSHFTVTGGTCESGFD